MIKLLKYRGHIRNWSVLCSDLGIDKSLPQNEREKQIILRAYQTWGANLGLHVHGMFSFALNDSKTGEIFCLRDPFGTKPFYYYVTPDGQFLCGTTIGEIIAQPGFVKEFNNDLLQIYLTMTYTTGEDTFFKGLKKLMPGHWLTWNNGKIEIGRYWKPEFHPDESKSLEDWANEIHHTLQIILAEEKEDGSYAESFLSGGVDSSYMFALSKATVSNSCGYDNSNLDESALAAKTAAILNKENRRCLITPEAYFGIVHDVMYHMEQPLGDASAVAFALGCAETAKHTKVCYSGEGADEFFGGYNMYRNAARYGDNLKTFYVGNTNIMKEDEKEKILKHYRQDFRPIDLIQNLYEENEELDPLSKMMDIDIQVWLEGDIYLNVDKMGKAVDLDIRMPITDLRIFDIASRMPARFKVNDEYNKVAFRTAASKVLPSEIAFRKKLGFVVPIRYWLADSRYNQDVVEKFHSDFAAEFFNISEINQIFDEYIGGNSDNWRKVWTIYAFLVWYEEYFVKR